MERITATEAARRFSDMLNRVRYQNASFEITRGNEVIAHVLPAAPRETGTIKDLLAAIDAGPRLEPGDAESWVAEVEALRREMTLPDIEWE